MKWPEMAFLDGKKLTVGEYLKGKKDPNSVLSIVRPPNGFKIEDLEAIDPEEKGYVYEICVHSDFDEEIGYYYSSEFYFAFEKDR